MSVEGSDVKVVAVSRAASSTPANELCTQRAYRVEVATGWCESPASPTMFPPVSASNQPRKLKFDRVGVGKIVLVPRGTKDWEVGVGPFWAL